MGTSRFAAEILSGLVASKYNIVSVYTGVDKKNGREQKMTTSEVKILAEKNKLPVFEPEKFDEQVIAAIRAQEPDIIIVAAYGKILPNAVLKIPGFGALNVHPSLLPSFRGPSPIQNAILEGETRTGTTIMLMNEGVDTGDILAQEEVFLSPEEKYPEVMEKIADISAKLLIKTLPLWVERKISPQKQNDSDATTCQLIERSDGHIIWTDSATSIYNRSRAFHPWPGIFTYWEKDGYNLRLKLHEISIFHASSNAEHQIGEIFKLDEKVAVQTGEDLIILENVQLEGKNKANISDFINGYPKFIGSLLK